MGHKRKPIKTITLHLHNRNQHLTTVLTGSGGPPLAIKYRGVYYASHHLIYRCTYTDFHYYAAQPLMLPTTHPVLEISKETKNAK